MTFPIPNCAWWNFLRGSIYEGWSKCTRSSAPPSNQELTSVNIPIPSPIPANPPAHFDHREKLLEITRGWPKSNKMDSRRTKIKFSNKTAQDLADPVFKAEIEAVQRSFEEVVHNKQTVDMQSCELYGIKETLQLDIIKAWCYARVGKEFSERLCLP